MRAEIITEDMIDSMAVMEDNLNEIKKLLAEIEVERNFINGNLDRLLKETRNAALMESALATLEMVDGPLDLDSSDEEEDEDDNDDNDFEDDEDFDDEDDDEDDLSDICGFCGAEDVVLIEADTNDGRMFLCPQCYEKHVIEKHQKMESEEKEVA